MNFLISSLKIYGLYILGTIIVSMGIYITILKYNNSSKEKEIIGLELQAAQLRLNIETERRNALIQIVEATTNMRKETANEEINTTINSTDVVTGIKWL